jgi:hypothetical protein
MGKNENLVEQARKFDWVAYAGRKEKEYGKSIQ